MWAEETSGVAAAGGLSRGYHQELESRHFEPWVRRVLLTLLGVFVVAGLFSVFGQTPATVTSAVSGGTLSLTAPTEIRGGLLYQTKVVVEAGPDGLRTPQLAFSPAMVEGITLNTLVPAPAEEESSADEFVFTYPKLEPGTSLTVWMDSQVNPTTVGSRALELELRDDGVPVTRVSQPQNVLP